MRAYIDSDILIWHLRGEPKALRFLEQAHTDSSLELWTGAMQRAEVVFFMRAHEAEATLRFLSMFKTQSVDQAVVDYAASLYQEWGPAYGIDVNDALLAASCMLCGGKIYTLNKKHYPMPDVVVERAW